ncbi:hypothetical protein OIU78_020232, partial [Salix suchowensis]
MAAAAAAAAAAMEWRGIAAWLADTGSGCLVISTPLFFSFIYLDLVEEEEGESLF